MIEVITPGALTSIQDESRTGAGSDGIAPSGPFDVFAHRAACMLVGESDTSLEITLTGPSLRFEVDAVVAITGARGEATLDGDPAPWDRSLAVTAGQVLSIGKLSGGARASLAVRGGFAVPRVRGSRATHVAAGLGPEPLSAGSRLVVGMPTAVHPMRRLRAPDDAGTVRAIHLSGDGLFAHEWTVSQRADRTGVRLEGARLRGSEIPPEAMLFGSVQVPPDGSPIVLGPDRPITGGYAPVATVIEADLGVVARARPGDTLRFMLVTVEQARAAWVERVRALEDAIETI